MEHWLKIGKLRNETHASSQIPQLLPQNPLLDIKFFSKNEFHIHLI